MSNTQELNTHAMAKLLKESRVPRDTEYRLERGAAGEHRESGSSLPDHLYSQQAHMLSGS